MKLYFERDSLDLYGKYDIFSQSIFNLISHSNQEILKKHPVSTKIPTRVYRKSDGDAESIVKNYNQFWSQNDVSFIFLVAESISSLKRDKSIRTF